MTEAAKFFADYGDLLLQKVEMNFIAQIVSFSASKYTATIRPMLFAKNEAGNGQVLNVPDVNNVPVERVTGIKHKYKKGDLVTVKAFASAIQQPLDGSRANMKDGRFQLSSCVVAGAVKIKIPEVAYITLDGASVDISGPLDVTGPTSITGPLTVTGAASVSGALTAGAVSVASLMIGPLDVGALLTEYLTHKHAAGTYSNSGGAVTGESGVKT